MWLLVSSMLTRPVSSLINYHETHNVCSQTPTGEFGASRFNASGLSENMLTNYTLRRLLFGACGAKR